MNVKDCPRCNGTGIDVPDDVDPRCEDCGGTGVVEDRGDEEDDHADE